MAEYGFEEMKMSGTIDIRLSEGISVHDPMKLTLLFGVKDSLSQAAAIVYGTPDWGSRVTDTFDDLSPKESLDKALAEPVIDVITYRFDIRGERDASKDYMDSNRFKKSLCDAWAEQLIKYCSEVMLKTLDMVEINPSEISCTDQADIFKSPEKEVFEIRSGL